ncbi:DUF4279 domain-containing protein [Sphingobacterium paludis]|uniref:Uncharacterized protein DUF4279 n=1 Tax=Sphingobacterium paludis TaxID=1476465 RepID=A0A4R7DA25_9SPHI|nr:DUF4279 domain-containing protein [Sphingobacterium paludis]TDS17657.1 uncharacterized protein DUF4279 [Sphingobacterium paludis]
MTTEDITNLVEFELKNQEFGVTEQILEIHSPALLENKLQIANVAFKGDAVSVFIPIEGEHFYLVFYIDTEKREITGISTEPYISVYFKATSKELSASELNGYTNLELSESWNKGDKKPSERAFYSVSGIIIEPNTKPNDFETKFKELISELKKDKAGVQQLAKFADGYIQVVMDFHNGNGILGGPNLNEANIRDLNDLGLSIDFAFYASGRSYKS